MDRRGVGRRWGGVLLSHLRAVYAPSERRGKRTNAVIHVDNVGLRELECGVLVYKAEERAFDKQSRSALRLGQFVVPIV